MLCVVLPCGNIYHYSRTIIWPVIGRKTPSFDISPSNNVITGYSFSYYTEHLADLVSNLVFILFVFDISKFVISYAPALVTPSTKSYPKYGGKT